MSSAGASGTEPVVSVPRQRPAIGIDLGTTNSLVAFTRGGRPVCTTMEGGATTLPSVVFYGSDGGVLVGRMARDELAPAFPRDTIASAKRFMGRGASRAGAAGSLLPYELVTNDRVVQFSVAGGSRRVTPVEVSAEILRTLRARAEAELQAEVSAAVITVPAYFDDAQRQATRDAGKLAGLDVLRLLNEPTAAALAYGLDKRVEGTFAVFDLGGGTFDISLLRLCDGIFEVLSTGGDSALGGDDFDQVIAYHLAAQWGIDHTQLRDSALIRAVLDAARDAKERLTESDVVEVELRLADSPAWRGALTREAMESLIGPVLERCARPVRRALKDAQVTADELAGVILVGGATRMPLVRRFVRELFGQEPLADVNPEEVVALGAAIQANLLTADDVAEDVLLLDVVPLSLGLETVGGMVERLISRNTRLPYEARQTFTTYAQGQTGFELHVVQGERAQAVDCRSLARFTLTGIPPLPAGMARLEVSFVVDTDGILNVSARELVSERETTIQVKPTYGLTEQEIGRMLADSVENLEQDSKVGQLTEQRVDADRMVAATRAALKESPHLLEEAEHTAILKAVALVEQAGSGTSLAGIKWAIGRLDASTKGFAGRRMNEALKRSLAGKVLQRVESVVEELSARRSGNREPEHGLLAREEGCP